MDFVDLSNRKIGWGKFLTGGVKVIKLSQRHRRLSPIDAIGIWVRTGKSIEEWLKIKGF